MPSFFVSLIFYLLRLAMAKFHHYLNFNGQTEEAFHFYTKVFDKELHGEVMRFKDVPDLPNLNPGEENKVMHVGFELADGVFLMGTDCLESLGQKAVMGTNQYICIGPDSFEQAERWFNRLAEGGKVGQPLAKQFWGAVYGDLTDKFGVQWMVNFEEK